MELSLKTGWYVIPQFCSHVATSIFMTFKFRFFNVKIVGGSRWCVMGMKTGDLLCSIPSSKLGDV